MNETDLQVRFCCFVLARLISQQQEPRGELRRTLRQLATRGFDALIPNGGPIAASRHASPPSRR